MKVPSCESEVLHAALDGDDSGVLAGLDAFTDHELWDFHDVCITLTRTIGNVLLQRLEGARDRPPGTVAIGGTSS